MYYFLYHTPSSTEEPQGAIERNKSHRAVLKAVRVVGGKGEVGATGGGGGRRELWST